MDGEGEGACRARQHLFGSLMFDGMGWNGRGECGEKPDTKLDTGEKQVRFLLLYIYNK